MAGVWWAAGVWAWGAPAVAVDAAAAPVRTVHAAEYREQLRRVREVVRACAGDAKACDAGAVGDDDRVSDGGFDVHWDWVRAALEAAKKGDREKGMGAAAARLDEMAREAGMEPAAAGRSAEFATARRGADAVLARAEFRRVAEEAYWRRAMARVSRWLGRLFSGAAGLGKYAGWLVPTLEWGFVLAVAVGALLWGLRVMQRQRLAIAMEASAPVREWEEASRRWAEAARDAAEAGQWREAVHSLYWASVVELEGRRVWRQSRGRTPREYLRLLDAGSPYAGPVRGLTQLLERIWYGLGAAERGDYERARALYDQVRAS